MRFIRSLLAFTTLLCSQTRASDRPNILFIMADDLGWYQNALTQVNNYKMEMGTIIGEYREQFNDPVKRAEIEKKMGAVDKKKKDLLESVKRTQPFVANIIALDTYLSYQNSTDAKKYKDELDYFATEYIHFADLSDPAYNDIPMVYDLSKSYTEIVTQLGFKEDLL